MVENNIIYKTKVLYLKNNNLKKKILTLSVCDFIN